MQCSTPKPEIRDTFEQMAIKVTRSENRPVSFTNKEVAYYYTQSHVNDHPEHAWFEGLTVAQQKIFNGYELYQNGEKLDWEKSELEVYPHKSVRKYENGIEEEFWMFDRVNILEVGLQKIEGTAGIKLKGLEADTTLSQPNLAVFHSNDYLVCVAAVNNTPIHIEKELVVSKGAGGFIIVSAKSLAELASLQGDYFTQRDQWKAERRSRIARIVTDVANTTTNIDSLDLALKWLAVTMDQLVTHQRGYGIYAGLPWFAEYWGRDEFISLPGACLVTGEFDIAKKILLSFIEFQDTVVSSPFFGRIPNIVKAGAIDYHTTDGTPRLIIQLMEYVKYSGDTEIIQQAYPSVVNSIEGALKNWTDEKGYLLHEENETWMDARRQPDLAAYSPRDTRANDIQALWYDQLMAGVFFANEMNDSASAEKWQSIAAKVKANFEEDFTTPDRAFIADRLDRNDQPDFQLRPNQLFAFDLIESESMKLSALHQCWEELVYPWGTASLDRDDPFFHPFHLKWENYHKDEAYHNGTIWLWLNGIAMQRMLEFNQTETAYQLFKNMNDQVLEMGVVGGLGENMDAYPHTGKNYPKLTGTYLQAWSNAEQMRVWSAYFLGVRPDLIADEITLAPRIPREIHELNSRVTVGKGSVSLNFQRHADRQVYSFLFENINAKIKLDIPEFAILDIGLDRADQLEVAVQNDQLTITKKLGDQSLESSQIDILHERHIQQEKYDEILKDIPFCIPLSEDFHAVLREN